MTRVEIGVFAHNEEQGIAGMLNDLLAQDIFFAQDITIVVHVLANGCSDDTVTEAKAALAGRSDVHIHDLPEPGKSRTWERFVHDLAWPDAEYLIFADADIYLPNTDTLSGLIGFLETHNRICATSSRPVKDIAHDHGARDAAGFEAKLIAAAGGSLYDWKSSICGQLYAVRGDVVRCIHMPVGLPVEDGFLRAMLHTDSFTKMGRPVPIDGKEETYHIYRSERQIGALIRHQERLVIGSAINAVIFRYLENLPLSQRKSAVAAAAQDANWLPHLINEALPDKRFGFVPWHFLVKRLQTAWTRGTASLQPKRLAIVFLGFGFDAVVWFKAQWTMMRGAGAGFW